MSAKQVSKMTDLVRRVGQVVADPETPPNETGTPATKPETHAKVGYGMRGDFVKISVTLPPELVQRIGEETLRRKVSRGKGSTTSAVIREALEAYFSGGAR